MHRSHSGVDGLVDRSIERIVEDGIDRIVERGIERIDRIVERMAFVA